MKLPANTEQYVIEVDRDGEGFVSLRSDMGFGEWYTKSEIQLNADEMARLCAVIQTTVNGILQTRSGITHATLPMPNNERVNTAYPYATFTPVDPLVTNEQIGILIRNIREEEITPERKELMQKAGYTVKATEVSGVDGFKLIGPVRSLTVFLTEDDAWHQAWVDYSVANILPDSNPILKAFFEQTPKAI